MWKGPLEYAALVQASLACEPVHASLARQGWARVGRSAHVRDARLSQQRSATGKED